MGSLSTSVEHWYPQELSLKTLDIKGASLLAGGRQGFAGLLIVSFVKGINKSYEITTISSSGNVGFELMLITCLPQGSTVFVDGLGKWRQENRQKAWPHSALELKCGTWMQVLEWPSMPVPSPENYGHEFCYVRHGQPSPPLPSHNAKHCILKGLPSLDMHPDPSASWVRNSERS